MQAESPFDKVDRSKAEQNEQTERLEQQVADLKAKIDTAEETLLFITDARTRQSCDKRVSKMRHVYRMLRYSAWMPPRLE